MADIYQDEYGTWRDVDTGAEVAAPGPTCSEDWNAGPVELCTRIADIPGGETFGLEHWWLRTPNAEAGMGPAGGGVPGHGGVDSPYVTQTEITDHTGQGELPDATCIPVSELGWPNVDQYCVEAEMAIGTDTGTWTPTNQCHTVIEDILDECSVADGGTGGGAAY